MESVRVLVLEARPLLGLVPEPSEPEPSELVTSERVPLELVPSELVPVLVM